LDRDGVPFKMEWAEAAIRVDEEKTAKKIKLLARSWVGHARVRAAPVHAPVARMQQPAEGGCGGLRCIL